MIGETLSHYRLLERLGAGGMAEVYRAVDTRLGRPVALKILPAKVAEDRERLERFEREARAVAALNHPNIVTLYDFEEVEGHHLLSLELVEGHTLAAAIPPEGLPLEQFFAVALPLTDAVAAAHEHGILHRDLKPANVMLSAEGRVKVLDFGLAKLKEDFDPSSAGDASTAALTSPGHLLGTMPYMSPEQLQGLPLDARTDIFSLGAVLYEMATGLPPFRGDSPAELISAILRDEPQPARGLRPELPGAVVRILRRCLEKDPRRRLQTVLDLHNELVEAAAGTALEEEEPSIAVLAFADMSPERDQAYFCEGIAEELINALARIEGLKVASRTSAFQFDARAADLRDVGRRLGVASVLEGSVRKAGDRLRITADLVDATNGYELWSARFDRRLEDVFQIQEEIAASIAAALRLTFGPEARRAMGRAPTPVLDAYDCYLRGRSYFYQYRKQSMRYALELFTRAIELDPGYARAYAGIADACAYLRLYGGEKESSLERADAASRKAIELDPELAEAHASRAVTLSLSGRPGEAEREFETAVRLDPDLYEAHYFFARHAFTRGDPEKAIRLYERASEVRPDDYQAPLLMAQIYEDLGRRAQAAEVRRRGLRIAEQHLQMQPDDTRALSLGANALVALGAVERGLRWARRARAVDPDDPMLLYNVGCILSMAGEAEEAIDCLEKAAAGGLAQREWYENDNNLDPLRPNPRFARLLATLDWTVTAEEAEAAADIAAGSVAAHAGTKDP